jgi:hypothetical protein
MRISAVRRTQSRPARLGHCIAMHQTDISTTEPPSKTPKCYKRGKEASSETSRRIDAYFAFERVQTYSKHPRVTYRPRTSNKRAEFERRPSGPDLLFAVKPFPPTHVDRTWSLHSFNPLLRCKGNEATARFSRPSNGSSRFQRQSDLCWPSAIFHKSTVLNAVQYQTGLGACGWYNTNSDYIGEWCCFLPREEVENALLEVALNANQYGGGCSGTAHCGEKLTITFGDTSGSLNRLFAKVGADLSIVVTATVADCCPGCSFGGLDMSPGLFARFADTGA